MPAHLSIAQIVTICKNFRVLKYNNPPARKRVIYKIKLNLSALFCLSGLLAVSSPDALGQWQTQTFELKQGWNAIYTHVDAKHTTIEQLVADTGVEEVWRWRPKLSNMQYIQSPDQPMNPVSRWTSWKSIEPTESALQRLSGNTAYLVRAAQDINLSIKGKVVPPRYQWTNTGLNFIGFSTQAASPPVFANFLSPVNGFGSDAQFFAYNGGDLGISNPAQLFTLNTSTVNRGQAYWVRATGYNRYYGPFETKLQDWSGVHFSDDLSSYKIVLKNITKSDLTVSMQLIDSDPAPVQEDIPSVAGTPPIILRESLQTDTMTHGYSAVNGQTKTWTLKPNGQPGSAVELRLGVHWAQLIGSEGDKYSGILRFTDSLGYLQTDLPLTVTKPSTTGLWVGQANIFQVRNSMKLFEKSIVEGDVSASVNSTESAPVTVSWLKKQATQTPLAGKTYVSSDTGFHLVQIETYPNVSKGDALRLPQADENGTLLTDPAAYWQARPHHEAFVKGWYHDAGSIIATGDRDSIEMKFVRKTIPTFLDGFTVVKDNTSGAWHFETEIIYEDAAVDDSLAPPAIDESGNELSDPLAYWSPIPGTWSLVAGNITLKWRKISAETKVYETITVDGLPTLFQHEYQTVNRTVYPRQRLTGADIYSADMPAAEWAVVEAAKKPPFDWEGDLAMDNGAYVIAHNDNSWGKVAKPMRLRLILHNNADTVPVASLLQRVYFGVDSANGSLLLSTNPNLLPDAIPDVRRVSAVHLPWSKDNQPWQFTGSFAKGGTLTTQVAVEYDDHASNPFLHTYHPDHDNLNARFENKLVQGNESYQVIRDITLRLNGSQSGFDGLSSGGITLIGEYEEIITLGGKAKPSITERESRQYGMKGTVVFRRITPEADIITQ